MVEVQILGMTWAFSGAGWGMTENVEINTKKCELRRHFCTYFKERTICCTDT
jgi:hypothetical protein